MDIVKSDQVIMRVLIACEYSGRVRDAFIAMGHDAMSCDLLATESPGPHYQGDVRNILDGYMPLSFAHDCDPEGDGWCQVRDIDPAECNCIDPTQDGIEYIERDGELFGRPEDSPQWDLMIAHPPCTYLTGAAEWAYSDNPCIAGVPRKIKKGTLIGEARRQARQEALDFVALLWNAPIERICIENPVGVINANLDFMPQPQYIQQHWFGEDASKKTGLWLKNLPLLRPTNQIAPRIVNGKERWGNQTDSGQNKLPPSANRWKIRSTTPQGIAVAFAEQWLQSAYCKK
jgi:hypothetical protein